MLSCKLGALLLCGITLIVSLGRAEDPKKPGQKLTLSVGDYSVTFLESASWTMDALKYKGVSLITPTGANQTVVKLNSSPGVPEREEWIGTKHGHEVVQSISLLVDGQSFDLTRNLPVPKGSRYAVIKESRFGPYIGHWEVELDASGLKETAKFDRVDDIDKVAFVYVFMHCWSPKMMDWMARLKDGTEVGDRFPDKAGKSLQNTISLLAVYSESEQTGGLLVYAKPYTGYKDKLSFLNNFPGRHNKLYLTVSRDALTAEEYSCTVRGFSSAPDAWKKTAMALAGSP